MLAFAADAGSFAALGGEDVGRWHCASAGIDRLMGYVLCDVEDRYAIRSIAITWPDRENYCTCR